MTSVTLQDTAERVESDPNGLSAHDAGSKLDAGKPLPFLVLSEFSLALAAVVDVGTFGANKYTPRGWCSADNGEERYEEAQVRHQLKRWQGEIVDPDSGLLHEAHEAWNALSKLELRLRNERTKQRKAQEAFQDYVEKTFYGEAKDSDTGETIPNTRYHIRKASGDGAGD